MPGAISKLQRFLGGLLCAVVLSAALDNIPDPPVVKPHGNQASLICLTNAHPVAEHDRTLDRGLLNAWPWALNRFDCTRAAHNKPLLPIAPVPSQASDSSPPFGLRQA